MTDDILGCFKLNCQATSSYWSNRLGPIGLSPIHQAIGPVWSVHLSLSWTDRTGPRPRLNIPGSVGGFNVPQKDIFRYSHNIHSIVNLLIQIPLLYPTGYD